jgi:hypothetical protein
VTASTIELVHESTAHRRSRIVRGCCLAFLYFLAALWGVVQIVSANNGAVYLIFVLLFATSATYAAIEDGRLRQVQWLRIVQFLFLITWPFASLIYLMATRGWRGLGWWCLHAVGLIVATCLTYYPTFVILYAMGMLDPHI